MTVKAVVVADSVSPHGVRLTTLSCQYARIIHAEMLRHRQLARCAASSRAIPVQRFIDQVARDPFIPSYWGSNQPGMQAGEAVSEAIRDEAKAEWLHAAHIMCESAQHMKLLNIHKEIANRLLEPFQWMAETLSGTEWSNFFNLRCHPAAHPEIQRIARAIQNAMATSEPELTETGFWHLPYLDDEDMHVLHAFRDQDPSNPPYVAALDARDASVGRAARTSYYRHEDESDLTKDIERSRKMRESSHMSPFEHVARPMTQEEWELHWAWQGTGHYRGAACVIDIKAGRVVLTDERGRTAGTWRIHEGGEWWVPQHMSEYGATMQRVLDHLSVNRVGVARIHGAAFSGNYNGWVQYRRYLQDEHDPLGGRHV